MNNQMVLTDEHNEELGIIISASHFKHSDKPSKSFQMHSGFNVLNFFSDKRMKLLYSNSIGNNDVAIEQYQYDNKPFMFAKVFLFMVVSLILSMIINQDVLVMVIMGSIIPLTFLLIIYEFNRPKSIDLSKVIIMFVIGGMCSIALIVIPNMFFNFLQYESAKYHAAYYEEIAKLIIVIFFINKYKPRYILNGILIGVAVGAGFDAIENIIYAYDTTSYGFSFIIMGLRSFTAIWMGHHYFAGMIGGAICMMIGNDSISIKHIINMNLLSVLIITMLLHLLWNIGYITMLPVAIITPILFIKMMKVGIMQYNISRVVIYADDNMSEIKYNTNKLEEQINQEQENEIIVQENLISNQDE